MAHSETQPLLESNSYQTQPEHDSQADLPVRYLESLPGSTQGKSISWASAYILVVSRVIGSGIFATPGSIVKSAGSIGLTLLVWLVGTILAACGMAISMEYGCMLPRSGGDKVYSIRPDQKYNMLSSFEVYLEYTYPRPRFLASTLIVFQAVVLGFSASNCIIFAKYVLFAFKIEPTDLQQKALAVGLLTAVTIIHGCFLKTGIAIQNALGWVKLLLIGAMSLTGVWVLLLHFFGGAINVSPGGETSTSISWDYLWEGSNWSWSLLSTSVFKVIYSYAGLSNVNNVLDEVKDPVRTLKSVCPSALVTAGGLYFLANLSYLLVVPLEEIKNSGELVAALLFQRLFGEHVGRTLFPLAIAISAAGNVMVVTFALARVNQEIARQGFLPWQKLLSSSRPFGSPLGGLIVHYIPSLLVITLPPQGDVYNFILDVEGYPGTIFGLAVTIGLLILRYKEPHRFRPYKVWLPAVFLRIVVCFALLAAPFIPPPNWQGDVDFFYATILLAIVYWYVWTVLLPRWGGYKLVETVDTLDDGTSITKLDRSYDVS
ncbi:hypothetical protein N7476_003811 [Penicillium atrosanguineum]|uniref:Methionine permease n=1 Tax=Penicillium atrosanguineum TaxID=1132637 RepID=A0A9W9PZ40_9EURO|nr:hypothetical protein N7476_003811 [Penicillium atrosanguineum]